MNKRVLALACDGASAAGANVTVVDLAALDLPVFGGLEAVHKAPHGALELQALVSSSDALLIATPEHNAGVTALLKNALDWSSVPLSGGISGKQCYGGKRAAIVSASPGPAGGLQSQVALQMILHKLGVHVLGDSFALGFANKAFAESGELVEPWRAGRIRAVGAKLAMHGCMDSRLSEGRP